MKILICPDSFKGSIDARGAAESIASGVLSACPEAEILLLPVADGGEGTLEALTRPEDRYELTVTGPDGKPVLSGYGHIGEHTAVIEMARAAGLTLVPEEERNPLTASTYGVGELIRNALDRGYRNILLTAGGSGTNDGGTGALEALGAGFFDQNGDPLHGCGGALGRIARIDPTNLDPRLKDCKITIATDVNNPLFGENGATMIYGPQKGADADMLALLEVGMKRYASILTQTTGKQIAEIPGCGAAGGLPAPFLAFADTRLMRGIDCVLAASGFLQQLTGCFAVITGEGRTDGQSACGKVIDGIARPAHAAGVPVYVLSGCTGTGWEKILDAGVTEVRTIVGMGVDPKESIQNPAPYLKILAEGLAKDHFIF